MEVEQHALFFELFGHQESFDLLGVMLHFGEYEEVRAYAERSQREVEEQIKMFVSGALAGGQLHWAIRDHESGPCIGSLQVTARESGFFVAYQIATLCRGAGKATQAVQWLLKELHAMSPETPILATVNARNMASIRVLQKNGFLLVTREGNSEGDQHEHVYQFKREA